MQIHRACNLNMQERRQSLANTQRTAGTSFLVVVNNNIIVSITPPMTMLRKDSLVVGLVLSASTAAAFTASKTPLQTPFPSRSALAMAEEDKGGDPKFVSSVFKKELAFDEKSGRFFETGFGEGDCIPEDEFCIVDKDTGATVRLTVEEKERIFLDALQVRLTIMTES